MKKLLRILLVVCFSLCIALTVIACGDNGDGGSGGSGNGGSGGGAGGGSGHTCEFTVKNAIADNLNTSASCTAKATYFYVCSVCGAKGTETFEDGDFAHNFNQEKAESAFIKEEANCTTPALY